MTIFLIRKSITKRKLLTGIPCLLKKFEVEYDEKYLFEWYD